MVWTGLSEGLSAVELKQKYARMAGRGITGVFLSDWSEPEVDAIKSAGLELHLWQWTTNRRENWIRDNHPEWFMVSRSGKSCFDQPPYVEYYRWISPAREDVREYLCERFAEAASLPGVDGVHLDYVRYPDVILPRALWETYGLDQTEELEDYDFCYSEATRDAFRAQSGRDPLEIVDPATDQEWLRFRYDSVTGLVNQLVDVVKSAGKEVSAAVFPTPSLARKICRQDWDKWPLDFFTPMIYHSFYNQTLDWVGDCVREDIQATQRPIVAGLYMPAFETAAEFKDCLRLVRRRGAAGVSLFGEVGADHWDIFESERWS